MAVDRDALGIQERRIDHDSYQDDQGGEGLVQGGEYAEPVLARLQRSDGEAERP
ncbi:hypothetical protein D3C72_2484600 [compost metagenome]